MINYNDNEQCLMNNEYNEEEKFEFDNSKKPVKGTRNNLKNEIKEFIHPDIIDLYIEYMTMREEIKKPIRSISSLKRNYDMLLKLSGSNLNTAKDILIQSISNQWQGLFELKQLNKNSYGTNKKSIEDEEAELEQAVAEGIARAMYKKEQERLRNEYL